VRDAAIAITHAGTGSAGSVASGTRLALGSSSGGTVAPQVAISNSADGRQPI
jgi:hypothetical protein